MGRRGADSGGSAKKAKTAENEDASKQTVRNNEFKENRNADIGEKQLAENTEAENLPANMVDASSERGGKQETEEADEANSSGDDSNDAYDWSGLKYG